MKSPVESSKVFDARIAAEDIEASSVMCPLDSCRAPIGEHSGKYSVQEWSEPSSTITGSDRIGSGALCIADPMGQTLLLAWSGQTFQLSAQPIWVQPVAVALSVKTPDRPE